ncbi:MAG: DUF2064 domain-containing protein, partial [Planctomycetota bacterium]
MSVRNPLPEEAESEHSRSETSSDRSESSEPLGPTEPRPVDLLVFAKPPAPGAVKTRLAATVGAVRAAKWAGAFLGDSLDRFGRFASEVGAQLVLVGDASTQQEFFARSTESLPWREPWTYLAQGSGHLGERMRRAFRESLDRGATALAVGADTPHLPAGLLRSATAALAA